MRPAAAAGPRGAICAADKRTSDHSYTQLPHIAAQHMSDKEGAKFKEGHQPINADFFHNRCRYATVHGEN